MLIESRTIVGAAAALALVGGLAWGSMFMFSPPAHSGSVEIKQVEEPSWSVEVKEMEPSQDGTKTAAAR
jgi:hypothetical protein